MCYNLFSINYTVIQKTNHQWATLFLRYLWFMIIDFNNFFTVEVKNDQRAYLE